MPQSITNESKLQINKNPATGTKILCSVHMMHHNSLSGTKSPRNMPPEPHKKPVGKKIDKMAEKVIW